jgi:hypothetical protein
MILLLLPAAEAPRFLMSRFADRCHGIGRNPPLGLTDRGLNSRGHVGRHPRDIGHERFPAFGVIRQFAYGFDLREPRRLYRTSRWYVVVLWLDGRPVGISETHSYLFRLGDCWLSSTGLRQRLSHCCHADTEALGDDHVCEPLSLERGHSLPMRQRGQFIFPHSSLFSRVFGRFAKNTRRQALQW